MTFKVIVLRWARHDVDSIVHWIAVERESPAGATSWLRAYDTALARLEKNPDSFPFAPENNDVDYDLRQFIFKTKRGRTYRGVFTIDNDEVRVLRIRGPGQPRLSKAELSDE